MTKPNELRMFFPDYGNACQIQTTEKSLINCFSVDPYYFINKGLIKSDGLEWLRTLEITEPNVGKTNFKFPALLLKNFLKSEIEVGVIAEIEVDVGPIHEKMELAFNEVSKEIDHGIGAIN